MIIGVYVWYGGEEFTIDGLLYYDMHTLPKIFQWFFFSYDFILK